MKIGTRVFLGLGINFWSQKYPKKSPSGCQFLKKISCTHFGRKYGDVGEQLQKNYFARTAVYSIYFAKMIIFLIYFYFQPVFLTLAKVYV